MPTLPATYHDFRGGLNTRDNPYLLESGEARDLANVVGITAGAIYKRNGLATFATPASALSTLYAFEQILPMQLIGAGGTSLYSISNAGVIAQIATGLASGLRWQFVQAPAMGAQGPLYGVNGTDPPQQWGGAGATGNWTNASGAVAVPNGKYCLYASNQVFMAGVAAAPSRVYWSAIADPTNWDPASSTGAGSIDLDPSDGQQITALGRVGPYVLVAKQRKLFVIVDTATATSRRISMQIGCVSHRSMQEGQSGTYFLGEDLDVYVTDGSKITQVSMKVSPTLAQVASNLASQAAGAYYNSHYYLSLPLASSTNDTTLDYDENLQSWWKHSFGSNHFAVWHPGSVAGLYSAKATAAIVDHCFADGVAVDNGTPFRWYWKGPWQSPSFYRRALFPTPYYRKRLRQLRVEGFGTVDVSLATDFTVGETLRRADVFGGALGPGDVWAGGGAWGGPTDAWGGGPTVMRARLHSLPVANAVSIVFSATSSTEDFIEGYTLFLTDRKDAVVGGV
jgi:hypothetical protein